MKVAHYDAFYFTLLYLLRAVEIISSYYRTVYSTITSKVPGIIEFHGKLYQKYVSRDRRESLALFERNFM